MKTVILIIEDNTDIRESSAEILELAGYKVLQADNGKEGVQIAIKENPGLILCDIMMPGLDGYAVLHMLGKHPDTDVIPFVFLTAKAERLDIRKGMEMGADDYLTKPFDDVALLAAVESRLTKQNKQQVFYSKSLMELQQLAAKNDGLEKLNKTIAERKARLVKKHQVIYSEGDQPQGIFLVLAGRFKTCKLSDDGRELITGIYSVNDYIGINALLLNEPYTEMAAAIEEGSICVLNKDTVDHFLSNFTDVGKQFIRILSNNVREKEEKLLHMAYNSVRKRMAEVLLQLQNSQSGTANDECLRISRDEMAAMTGMATETVSRILSDFTAEKLIEKEKSIIRILDKTKLQKMKN